jgi:hypothetical protein
MKKFTSIIIIIIVAVGFLVAGSSRAEAMHNESAVALTAGMFLLGIPVIHAIAQEAIHHERAYIHAYPPRYIERTKIIYVGPVHKSIHRHGHRKHDRYCRHGWDRHKDGRGHEDSDGDSRGHHDDD